MDRSAPRQHRSAPGDAPARGRRGGGRGRRSGSGRPDAGRRGSGGPSAASAEFTTPAGGTPGLPPVTAFDELDLPPALLAALGRAGIVQPFPIQASTLPDALAGRHVLGRGRTGSGKTLAFGLALLARTAGRRATPGRPLALVLVPTRELAQQVTDSLEPYAKAVGLRLATVVGGLSLNRQADTLRRGAEVVVATPGRLTDLVSRGDCRLEAVTTAVLDEADQMADMGFVPQVTALLDQVHPDSRHLLFSATLDRNVDRLVRRYLHDPSVHSVDPSAGAVTTMEHHLLHVSSTDKRATATAVAAREGRVIMFLDTKHAVNRFTRHLLASGIHAAALHGGKSQPQRTRTLEGFRTGRITVLVATNVAARGIHVEDVGLVVNVDPPRDHKDYLHRAGRTARAGESGSVVTLVLPEQRREMARLMSTARIDAGSHEVSPGDATLVRLTGARTPSGIPVTVESPAPAPAPARRSAPAGARRGRPRRGRRAASSAPRG
jgi:superfamily II DNA/RNA helicase